MRCTILAKSGGMDKTYVMWGDKSGGPYADGGYRNPVAEYVMEYKTSLQSTITANFKLEQKLDMVLKGLSFTGLFSFKNKTITDVCRRSGYNAFEISGFNPETLDYSLRFIGKKTEISINLTG